MNQGAGQGVAILWCKKIVVGLMFMFLHLVSLSGVSYPI